MKKIGIVTFHQVYNYGGMLQAYALCKAIKEHAVECIDYRQKELEIKYGHPLYHPSRSLKDNAKHFAKHYLLGRDKIKESKFRAFCTGRIPLSSKPCHNLEQVNADAAKYDLLISGSDQIWNPQFTGGQMDPVYFLDFGNDKVRRISYASSAGAYEFLEKDRQKLMDYLDRYSRISVREEFLKNQLNFLERPVEVVIDPTLLLNAEQWMEIAEPVKGLPEDFLLLYTFDNNQLCISTAHQVAKEMNIPVVAIWNQQKRNRLIDFCLTDIGPTEFLWLFSRARFVVTNSFHGTTFAINFKKSFYSIYKNNNPFRVLNLLKTLGLEDRLINDINMVINREHGVNYNRPAVLLEDARNRSLNYLREALS